MSLHESAFDYLEPTDTQRAALQSVRPHFHDFALMLDRHLPDGPDKTYVMRKLREVAMWCNVAITRQPDGAPRDYPPDHPAPGDLGSVPL